MQEASSGYLELQEASSWYLEMKEIKQWVSGDAGGKQLIYGHTWLYKRQAVGV